MDQLLDVKSVPVAGQGVGGIELDRTKERFFRGGEVPTLQGADGQRGVHLGGAVVDRQGTGRRVPRLG